MSNKKEDLRTIKTKKNIKNAFLELMKEKSYQSITVKDIAERAYINRKTFYCHYETKDDLYSEITNELTDSLQSDQFFYNIRSSRTNTQAQMEIVKHFFSQIKKHKDICIVMLNDKTNSEFEDKMSEKLSDALINSIAEDKYIAYPFTVEFLTDAFTAIFKVVLNWWVKSDCEDTDIALNCILRLFSKEPLELLGIKYD